MRHTAYSFGIAAAATLVAPLTLAHHNTGALFDLETEITLDGVVTEYEWRNPHVYIYVQIEGADEDADVWVIEAGPLALMRRLGWSRDTLATCDHVVVTGNPARDAGRAEAFLVAARPVGSALPITRGEVAFEVLFGGASPPARQADGLSGTWATLLQPDPAIDALLEDPSSLSLTERGAAAIENFDERSMHPGIDCIPYTAPVLMVVPDIKSIEISEEVVRIRGEFDGVERVIHLTGDSDTGGVALQGISNGRWEDGVLVVETTRFSDHRMGNGFSLASGAGKRLVERFELNDDGTYMTYHFVLEDPEYLTAPVTGETRWEYRPDLQFSPMDCDRDNARRFLED